MPSEPVLQFIPLEQLVPDPDQPRSDVSPEYIQTLSESLKTRQQLPIIARPLPEADKARYAPGQYMIVDGHCRYAAAKLAGLAGLSAYVQEMTPEEVEEAAYIANLSEAMSWLDKDLRIARIAKRKAGMPQRAIAARLQISQRKLVTALNIDKALTPGAVSLIKENIKKSLILGDGRPITKNKDFLITESMVEVLAVLEDPATIEKGLKAVWDNLMPEAEVKGLVSWVQAGNLVESFDPKAAKAAAKPVKPAKAEGAQEHHPAAHSAAVAPVGDPQAANGDHHRTLAQPSPAAHLVGDPQAMGSAETALYEALAGISVIAKIKAKIKKGERPSVGERFLLVGYDLWHGLMWLLKNGLKLAKLAAKWAFKAVKMLWHLVIDSLKTLGVYNFAKAIFVIVALIGVITFFWYASHNGAGTTVHWVYSKLFPAKVEATPSTPVAVAPTPQTAAKPSHKHKSVASVPTATPQNTAVVAQVTPTVVPKKNGDLVTQAAGAAPAVLQATDGVKKLFGF